MWRRRPTIVVDTYYNTISLDHSVEKRKFGFQKKFREIIATFFSVNLSNTFQSISRKFCKVVAFWNKSLMFPHCVDVSAVVFQSKCPKMSQLLHMTDQSITKLWLEPGSPKSFGKKHFHSKCYTYARRKGDDWKKKNSSFDHWKKKIRNRRLFDPIFFTPPQGIFGKSGRSSTSPLSCKTEKVKFSSYSCKLKQELIWNLAGSLIQGYLSYGKKKLKKKKKRNLKLTLYL